MSEPRAITALLDGLVDFAGLFPPAALTMADAVAAHARYVVGAERAKLGRFVVPVARLEELVAAVDALPEEIRPRSNAPWRLSVLAGAADAAALQAFDAAHGGRLVIDTVEAKAETAAAIEALGAALGRRYSLYVEIPLRDDPAALVAAIKSQDFRAKVRTGGVVTEAFPAPAEVLRFLVACVDAQVPFKATAGLHHPLRGEFPLTYATDSARGTMFGFLNVFLAAVLLHARAPREELVALLEERDPGAIRADDAGIRWRGLGVTTAQIAAARATFVGSFGSCSFEEPVRELTSLPLARP
jgi:hypothetical protein